MAKLTQIIEQGYDYDFGEERDRSVKVILETDEGKTSVGFHEGEPEDMYLFRDLNDAYRIYGLVQKAYELGKAGVEMEFEEIVESDEE